MEWMTTTTLLEGLGREGDDRAWERLVHRFRPAIVRFARGMGLSAGDAEEVAQETLVAALNGQRDGRYDRTRGRLRSWMFGIAVRQAQHARRKAALAHAREAPLHDGDSRGASLNGGDDPAIRQLWEHEWEQAILSRCLERARLEVEPITMRAFELVVADGRTPSEAATMLDVPVKQVYNAKHRVLKRIRELREAIEASEKMSDS